MAEFPALPIWTDALVGDTYHLSPAEFGAYMRLLICAWRTPECALPDDDRTLGKMVGDRRNWHKWKPVVMAFWCKGEDGLWRQKRLTSERKFVSTGRAKKVKAGRASALKRKETRSTPVPTQGQQPTPTPTPSSVEPNGSTGAEAPLDVDAFFYREGRRILGKQSGALLTKLKRTKGSPEAALKVLEVAQRKADPAAYVGAACKESKDLEADLAQVVNEAMEGWENGNVRG